MGQWLEGKRFERGAQGRPVVILCVTVLILCCVFVSPCFPSQLLGLTDHSFKRIGLRWTSFFRLKAALSSCTPIHFLCPLKVSRALFVFQELHRSGSSHSARPTGRRQWVWSGPHRAFCADELCAARLGAGLTSSAAGAAGRCPQQRF